MKTKIARLSFDSMAVLLVALILGVVTGFTASEGILTICTTIADIFMRLLKMISMPLIFFSLLSVLTNIGRDNATREIIKKLFVYTVLTTLIAAIIALLVYLWIAPAQFSFIIDKGVEVRQPMDLAGYLLGLVPKNLFQPFLEGNVIAVLFLAVLIGVSTQSLAVERQKKLHQWFEDFFYLIMAMTRWILKALPIVIWAFMVLLVQDLQKHSHVPGLGAYLLSLLIANGLQALVVLPILLYMKGISPVRLFSGVSPALLVAFLSKSSGAALPTLLTCAQKGLGLRSNVAKLGFPMCITINMNACAAFILITVLFVSQSHGVMYSPVELALWVVLAVMFAIGNAGVPMGCYMISSAILVSMDMPLHLMMLILPLYAVIDMFESAINVWSDCCVVSIVDKELPLSKEQ